MSLLVTVVLPALVLGCSYATRAPRVVKGQEFAIENAQTIRDGMAAAEAREALGEPLEVEEVDGGERWRYYARLRKDGVMYILGFIPKKTPHFIWDYELTFVVRDSLVEQVQYEETKIR